MRPKTHPHVSDVHITSVQCFGFDLYLIKLQVALCAELWKQPLFSGSSSLWSAAVPVSALLYSAICRYDVLMHVSHFPVFCFQRKCSGYREQCEAQATQKYVCTTNGRFSSEHHLCLINYGMKQFPLESPRCVWTLAICSLTFNSSVSESERKDFKPPWHRYPGDHTAVTTTTAPSLKVVVGLIKGERIAIQQTYWAVTWDLTSADVGSNCRLNTGRLHPCTITQLTAVTNQTQTVLWLISENLLRF